MDIIKNVFILFSTNLTFKKTLKFFKKSYSKNNKKRIITFLNYISENDIIEKNYYLGGDKVDFYFITIRNIIIAKKSKNFISCAGLLENFLKKDYFYLKRPLYNIKSTQNYSYSKLHFDTYKKININEIEKQNNIKKMFEEINKKIENKNISKIEKEINIFKKELLFSILFNYLKRFDFWKDFTHPMDFLINRLVNNSEIFKKKLTMYRDYYKINNENAKKEFKKKYNEELYDYFKKYKKYIFSMYENNHQNGFVFLDTRCPLCNKLSPMILFDKYVYRKFMIKFYKKNMDDFCNDVYQNGLVNKYIIFDDQIINKS